MFFLGASSGVRERDTDIIQEVVEDGAENHGNDNPADKIKEQGVILHRLLALIYELEGVYEVVCAQG